MARRCVLEKELKVAPCPRTKAKTCECEEVKTISEAEGFVSAKCELEHSDTVKGMIALMQPTKGGPTLIKGRIIGLTPGEHGFHIHEFGDLSNGCESAGAHYNPDDVDHGDLDKGHVGDLENVVADKVPPLNVKVDASSSSPEVPAITTLPEVKS